MSTLTRETPPGRDATRKRILIFTFTPISREPRALKQIALLKPDYELTTAGFGPAPDPDIPHIELEPAPSSRGVMAVRGVHSLLIMLRQFWLLSRFLPRDKSAFERLSRGSWDLIVAHDVSTVPVARRLAPTAGVLVDLHEYATRQGEHSLRWRMVSGGYFRWILRRHVRKAAAVSTVGQGIVDEYRSEFGLECALVANATPYHDLEPGLVGSPLRLVHSGVASAPRKPEMMIEAVKMTSAPVTLDLYLVDDDSPYFRELVELAGDDPRITFQKPVPYRDLVRTLNRYDVGLGVIAPSTFNLLWCLPNKFFDYIQARLGVIIGPSPEMERIVRKYGIGGVTADFTAGSLAELLDSLDVEQVREWKAHAHSHARELSSETQVKVWARMVDDLVGSKRR